MVDRPRKDLSHDQSDAERMAARWHTVFNAVVQGVITINRQGVIGSVNAACVKMFGYPESELIGNKVNVLMPEHEAKVHDRYIDHHLETGEKKIIGIGRKVIARRKDGTTFPVHLSVGKYALAHDEIEFVGILNDLSELEKAENEAAKQREEAAANQERIERMNRITMAGEMASGIAHEVNQPLSAIANYSRALLHMLGEQVDEHEELTETVEKIRAQSHRAAEIVQRMRGFVSKHPKQLQAIDLNQSIREVLSFAELSTHTNKINATLALEEPSPMVFIDGIQLHQVILNLLNNAVEATQEASEGEIEIRTRSTKDLAILEVKDQGKGVSQTLEDDLFAPFFSSKHEGTGIGLTICRSIVEANGGTIGFRRNRDRGVTFYVQLPAHDAT